MHGAVDNIQANSTAALRDAQRLRDATEQIVGRVFYGAMLKTLRESPMKGKYGHGGRVEEAFGAQLDAILAERMGKGTRRGLADTLFDALKGQQERISKLRTESEWQRQRNIW